MHFGKPTVKILNMNLRKLYTGNFHNVAKISNITIKYLPEILLFIYRMLSY